ncbi:fimbrial biogenesis chaperone [Paraburkholderia dinghuensis]|uniref:Molecular chaperone n=1 Tax=Paraburkholderia dinghuensis TaxID=2305225 RepID=A0A3N6N1I4_9BURK|nr:molecular chaperone [Paraburkholderia dinghuensis]RQH04351.1 molecular chaperone [Paraburkholderia dinghuensis]
MRFLFLSALTTMGFAVTDTMRTQIKVFVRPDKLPYPETDLPKHLTFSLVHWPGKVTLEIGNPTPYYATIGVLQLAIEDALRPETVDMIAPFSHVAVDVDGIAGTPGEHAKVLFALRSRP